MSRKRNPNFSENELQVLLDEVEKNITDCFQNSLTWFQITKNALVCEKVNVCNSSDHVRTVEEIRKKFSSYTSDTKKKIAQNRRESTRTGGGKAPSTCTDLTPLQEKLSGILGDASIEGIEGGIDTAECSTAKGSETECEHSLSLQHDVPPPAESHPMKKARRSLHEAFDERVFDIESEKLEIQKQRLEVERERLEIERKRLAMNRDL
ncbi:nuclear apoptosis-inducing factor 1-like [Saccostrea cucullata]|uniref:nuclear apoptosis-inducing factor 1-like n=1 Tax=Saccostrea cuccullata TaxID=36930 RepID=UPI002ED444B6